MRILFTNGRQPFPLFRGGDGVMIHTLLNHFSENQHSVVHIGKADPPEQKTSFQNTLEKLQAILPDQFMKNGERIIINSEDSYKRILVKNNAYLEYINRYTKYFKPDVVLTQLEESTNIIKICAKNYIKCIFALHDHDPLNYQTLNFSQHLSHVIFNSNNTKNHFCNRAKCNYSVIYSPIKFSEYKSNSRNEKYITFINPVKNKGSEIVDKLIEIFPDEKFLLVKGWKELETKNHFYPNVTVYERNFDMRNIYKETKILLIPSQWEESFGRVAPEAAINKIPIIASNVGGLMESVGTGGILIDEFSNINQWTSAVKKLTRSKGLRNRLGYQGYKYCRRFADNKILKKWDFLLNEVYTTNQ